MDDCDHGFLLGVRVARRFDIDGDRYDGNHDVLRVEIMRGFERQLGKLKERDVISCASDSL
ncbi:hypothetical protein L195_g063053, partial [Trifolium pratense]